MRYYRLIGVGKLQEISKTEYYDILRDAVKLKYHKELGQPFHGFNFMGTPYIVLPEYSPC